MKVECEQSRAEKSLISIEFIPASLLNGLFFVPSSEFEEREMRYKWLPENSFCRFPSKMNSFCWRRTQKRKEMMLFERSNGRKKSRNRLIRFKAAAVESEKEITLQSEWNCVLLVGVSSELLSEERKFLDSSPEKFYFINFLSCCNKTIFSTLSRRLLSVSLTPSSPAAQPVAILFV